MEDVLRITIASCLSRPAGDDHPDIVPLAGLDCIVQVSDALVRQIPVRGVVRPAIRVRVPVVPEDSHQADQVGRGKLRLKVEAIVALEVAGPPVDPVEGDRLTRCWVDQVGPVNPQPGGSSCQALFTQLRISRDGIDQTGCIFSNNLTLHYWLRPIEGVQFRFDNFGSHFIRVQIFQIDFSTLLLILSAFKYFRLILKRPNEHFSISFSHYHAIETVVHQLRKDRGTS